MDVLPLSSAISRTGTWTCRGPSTKILLELGNAVEKSDMPLSLHPPSRGARRRIRFQGSALNPVRDTPGGLKDDYIPRAEGRGQRARGKETVSATRGASAA